MDDEVVVCVWLPGAGARLVLVLGVARVFAFRGATLLPAASEPAAVAFVVVVVFIEGSENAAALGFNLGGFGKPTDDDDDALLGCVKLRGSDWNGGTLEKAVCSDSIVDVLVVVEAAALGWGFGCWQEGFMDWAMSIVFEIASKTWKSGVDNWSR